MARHCNEKFAASGCRASLITSLSWRQQFKTMSITKIVSGIFSIILLIGVSYWVAPQTTVDVLSSIKKLGGTGDDITKKVR